MATLRYELSWDPDPGEWPKRTYARAFEGGLMKIGRMWYEALLPKHFTNKAQSEYRYQAREKKYAIAKAKVTGRTAPLVGITRKGHQAGTLKTMTLKTGEIRATAKSVRVKFQVPGYALRRARKGQGPDLAAEMTAISGDDWKVMEPVMETALAEALENEPKRKRTRH